MCYKDYILKLRQCQLEEVQLVLHDLSPQLKKLVQALESVEGQNEPINSYYGNLKNVLSTFITFWEDTMDQTMTIIEDITHRTCKCKYLELVDQSIMIQKSRQVDFGKEYLPVTSTEEREAYEEINKKYESFLNALYKKKDKLEKVAARFYPNQVRQTDFVNDDLQLMLSNTYNHFEITYDYMAMSLINHMPDIRNCLIEINKSISNDLKQMKSEKKRNLSRLQLELYAKKNEQVLLTKLDDDTLLELGENAHIREMIARKVSDIRQLKHTVKAKLKKELKYWTAKKKDFDHIDEMLSKLLAGKESLERQEAEFYNNKHPNLPDVECQHQQYFKKNIQPEKQRINDEILETARTLMTHFAIKGFTNKLYKDNTGVHIIKEENRKMYSTQCGRVAYQLCDRGKLKKVIEHEKLYHYDKNGRYYIDNDNKIYRRDIGSSSYKLDDDGLLHKVPSVSSDDKESSLKSETVSSFEKLNITGTLDRESAKYIWDNFGSILPHALADLLDHQPNNPFHYLAHRLIALKYERSKKETQMAKEESDKYRADVLKNREEKLKKLRALLKAYLPKPCRADDLDNLELDHTCTAHRTDLELINLVNTDYRGYM